MFKRMFNRSLWATAIVVAASGIVMAGVLMEADSAAAGTTATGVGAGITAVQAAIEAEVTPTVAEVRQTVIDNFRTMRENSKSQPESYSGFGSLEFWSSGGLLMEIPPEGLAEEFELFNLHPKHITVITLVPDQAAVALFYMEGSLHPKGGALVGRYLTRVTQVFVKEDGTWRIRSSHWSPLTGGAGTNQVTVEQ